MLTTGRKQQTAIMAGLSCQLVLSSCLALLLLVTRVSSLRDGSFQTLDQSHGSQVAAVIPPASGTNQGRPMASTGESSGVGLEKFSSLKAALASPRLKASLFFNLMTEAGFLPAFLNALSSHRVTVLVPHDEVVRQALPRFNKLSKVEKHQILGYHVLSGILPSNFLQKIPSQTELATINKPHMLAMLSASGASGISFTNPGSSRALCSVKDGDAYQDSESLMHRTVLVHTVSSILSPPNFGEL